MKSGLIVIDGRFINKNISGIGRYSLGLLHGIAALDPPFKIKVLADRSTVFPQNISNAGCFDVITLKYCVKSFSNQIRLPTILRKYSIKVYHVPDSYAPLFCTDCKIILTVHDLIPIRCRRMLRKSKKAIFSILWENWLKLQCNKASAIITVSNHSKKDIIDLMNVPEQKLHVIYNGVSQFTKTKNTDDFRLKHGLLSSRVILYIGRFDPYKNIVSLVNAFNILIKSKVDAALLIVGAPDPRYPAATKRVKQLGLEQKVIFTGQMSDAEIASIFAISSVFVFPSLYEGFGLPPLEAMAYGVPVVSSNRTCLPEVLGDAALFVDPTNPDEMADAILQVLHNNKLRNNLISRGLNRAKIFTWEKTAEEHLRLYESLLV